MKSTDYTPEYDPDASDDWWSIPSEIIDQWELESWLYAQQTADPTELATCS